MTMAEVKASLTDRLAEAEKALGEAETALAAAVLDAAVGTDTKSVAAAQRQVKTLREEVDRLTLAATEAERREVAARDAEQAKQRAEREHEYETLRDRIQAARLDLAALFVSGQPMAATLVSDVQAARRLGATLGKADYERISGGGYQLSQIAGAVAGDFYQPSRAAHTIADAMAVLRRPWRVPAAEVPATDDAAAQADV